MSEEKQEYCLELHDVNISFNLRFPSKQELTEEEVLEIGQKRLYNLLAQGEKTGFSVLALAQSGLSDVMVYPSLVDDQEMIVDQLEIVDSYTDGE